MGERPDAWRVARDTVPELVAVRGNAITRLLDALDAAGMLHPAPASPAAPAPADDQPTLWGEQ